MTSAKREIWIVLAVVACVFSVFFFNTLYASFVSSSPGDVGVEILDVADYVRKVDKMYCIDAPAVNKLYYIMTFRAEKPVRIVLSTRNALLPGRIMICDLDNNCREVRVGEMTGVKPGTYRLYIGTSIPVTTLCVAFAR